ncbi:MAG: TolC family protein [Proteobacteria bacterium]|nr:TolC family protein [Pseudomonadota bacterium]
MRHNKLLALIALTLLLILALCMIGKPEAQAQTTREMTLSEAIEMAQKNARAWDQFDAREESAKAQYKQVESHWWPILSIDSTMMLWTDESKIDVMNKDEIKQNLSASMQNLDTQQQAMMQMFMPIVETMLPAVEDSVPETIKLKDNFTFTIGATLKMPLTPLFKVYQASKLAQIGIDNVSVERHAKSLAISYEVTEVYLKLVYAQLMYEVAQEALDTISKHVEMAQKYEAAGILPHTDVLSAKVELFKARQNVVEAKNGARLAGMKLAQVLSLGRGVEVRALDMPQNAYQVPLESLESYQDKALEARPELERIELGKEVAQRKEKMALLDYVPQIALVGSYQYGYGIDVLNPSNQGLVGLMMNWTVFDGLGHYYEARKASLEAAELEGKAAEARELIQLEVGQKYLALSTALERVELTQQALELAEENLRTVTAQFAQGESVNTDVLTAQTRHAAARADDVKARIDILIALAGLKLSLGEDPAIGAEAFI